MREHIRTKPTDLQALCTLSNTPSNVSPESLTKVIRDAPDPETATRSVFKSLPACSEVLESKWRKLITHLWSRQHSHLPTVLDLPIASSDVSEAAAMQDALAMLHLINIHPANMVREEDEWLLTAPDAYYIATQLPSLSRRPQIQLENEWQYQHIRRTRAVLEALRLVRRYKNKLVVVKSRYSKFTKLPATQQFYLLWHSDAYHVDWAQFAGMWSEYVHVMQEYIPLLWSTSENATPDMPYDIRQWNQNVWDIFLPVWEQEGILQQPKNLTAIFSLVRIQTLPTAITQIVLKDLYERYSLIYGEGELIAHSELGVTLLGAERTQDLPCSVDLLK